MNIEYPTMILIAFLLGSIPWGLVLTRCFSRVNILEGGSGNIGATNVRRLAGNKLGALTLAGDVLKGFVPVIISRIIAADGGEWSRLFVCTVAFSAFLGHLYPVYLKFRKGGKGVATAFGCFLAVSPSACLISLLFFILAAVYSKRVSAASLAAATVLPFAVRITVSSPVPAIFAALFFGIIVFRHTENIIRLVQGTEPAVQMFAPEIGKKGPLQ